VVVVYFLSLVIRDLMSYDYTVELKSNKILSLSLVLAALQLQH